MAPLRSIIMKKGAKVEVGVARTFEAVFPAMRR